MKQKNKSVKAQYRSLYVKTKRQLYDALDTIEHVTPVLNSTAREAIYLVSDPNEIAELLFRPELSEIINDRNTCIKVVSETIDDLENAWNQNNISFFQNLSSILDVRLYDYRILWLAKKDQYVDKLRKHIYDFVILNREYGTGSEFWFMKNHRSYKYQYTLRKHRKYCAEAGLLS